MSEFEKLVQETLDLWWRSSPVSASLSGEHRYDNDLDDCSREFIISAIADHRRLLGRLEQTDRTGLTREQQVDLGLLIDNLAATIRSLEEIRAWERNPAGPLQIAIYGIFVLVIRDFAPLEQRAESMLSRLRQVPRLLKQAEASLVEPVEIFTQTAIEVGEGGVAFFQGFVPQIADQVPKLKAELLAAARDAAEAIESYVRHLREKWLGRAPGSYAIGRELFDFLLKRSHGLDLVADDLVAIGKRILAETQDALERLAGELSPGKAWWEIVAELKRDHPTARELLEAYRQEMIRARDFTRERELVTIPEGEELELIWTPQFERATIPFAAYMAPAPLEALQKGYFYVTPVNEQLPPEKQEEQLQGHSRHKIVITALHEAYPGHHLQLCVANRIGSVIRRLLGTSVTVEGWALYCEEMMHEQGFYGDPRVRLMQLKDQLWRACRVLIDVGLHTQGMTVGEAQDLLVKQARLEPVNAEAEVRRYCASPTQPMSYCIGKEQIVALRQDYQVRLGSRFQLKEFHDRLLGFGSIPVPLIRAEMLGAGEATAKTPSASSGPGVPATAKTPSAPSRAEGQ